MSSLSCSAGHRPETFAATSAHVFTSRCLRYVCMSTILLESKLTKLKLLDIGLNSQRF